MSPAQKIRINPSPRLAVVLCIVHVAAGTAIWLAPVPRWLQAALTVALAASLVWALSRKAALHAAEAIVAVEVTDDGAMSFQTRTGAWHECELLGSSYVSPRLTILNLKPQGARRTRHVVLVPDNVDAGDFRRLRTWLRWAALPQGTRS